METIEFLKHLHIFSKELQILIISALPIIELRGAIPIGHLLNIDPIKTLIISLIGSMMPVPFLLIFLNPVFKKIRNYSFFRKKIDKLTHRTLKRINNVKTFSLISLVLFVAIPLPGTGIWTGSLAATLTNLDFKKAFFAILLGDIIAGILVTFITMTTFSLF
ncbi:MAG: small multi-drug export protein [Bacillota bacterium]|nr:small multi-drug export protein [Bacillota bacterium]